MGSLSPTASPAYVELHARSAFSFLRGASLPEQLAETAAQQGLSALALCDRNGVHGAPRFFRAAREHGIRPLIGCELVLEDGAILPVLVENRTGYRNLCRLLTRAHLRAPKNEGAVRWEELPEFAEGLTALTGDEEGPLQQALRRNDEEAASRALSRLRAAFGARGVFVELQRHHLRGEDRMVPRLTALAAAQRLPVLAANGALYAQPEGRAVLDVFTCLRHHTHLDRAGRRLSQNHERYLKSPAEMARLFADLPEALHNTVRLAERLQFTLEDLGYQFPVYPAPSGETMDSFLRRQTFEGARGRYGHSLPPKVRRQLEHELTVIGKLGFAGYFLIVWDIVNFCREQDIMCQGRGSAANSAVCYCLGITAADPVGNQLLFERFLSEGRQSWPDIDLDLPSGDRRERVIQEVYRRYGKHGAAMTANVITYRGRSAAREVGKALNLPQDILGRFSSLFASGDFPHTLDLRGQLRQAGLPEDHPRTAAFVAVYQRIYGLPRHLGQHSGGMIICQGQLDSVVPLENASMPGRVVAQWDKEDCENLGIIKVDLLGLGMMSVIQDAIALSEQRGRPVDLAQIPKDDPATYAMMQAADTIGVFQIESRAQMATLPRMRPACFYDVVIEVAIIRPGPIQGHLMHPYLARRAGREPVTYYDERLRPVLERTLGVPLFQEQMLKIAMVMADFSGTEAEELRRALSFHRSQERMQRVQAKLVAAMERRGVSPQVVQEITAAISSFALYGFPESHAISFALLAYGSAYLKVHRAPEFYVSLLNNQPMGFYSPATLIKDARRHGLRFRAVCALRSEWECRIESDGAIRLGFCMVGGLREEHARRILQARRSGPFQSVEDFKRRTSIHRDELRALAELGAFKELTAHRREALWQAEDARGDAGPEAQTLPLPFPETNASPLLPMSLSERIQSDYNGMNLSLGPHPMALLRPRLPRLWRAADLPRGRHGQRVLIGGQVICRQRPGTAKGFVFVSLEDETGISNAIVAPPLFERLRLVITQEEFLQIEGLLQRVDNVITVKARGASPLPVRHSFASSGSYDFR